MIKREINKNGIVADLYHDGTGQPRKAIVMLGGSEGGKTFSSFVMRKHRETLVNLGYTLLSLSYFNSPGLPEILEAIPLEYFESAFTWLWQQKEVVPDKVALLGMSKGGEVALVLGGINPKIKAVMALSPSSVVWQGIPKRGKRVAMTKKSSWAYQGKELPFIPYSVTSWSLGTVLFGGLLKEHRRGLLTSAGNETVQIPVEKIQGAILLTSGTRDQMWPSTEMSELITSRLAAKGFPYHYEHIPFDSNHNGYLLKNAAWEKINAFIKTNYS